MTRITLMSIAVAGAFGLLAAAQPGLAQTAPAQKAAPAEAPVYGYQMMTPAERDEFRQKMAAAKTAEERGKLRDEHHAQMIKRAEEQGVTLMGRRGDPQLYGQQLMTPDERNAYMEKMRAATTREERIKLRNEHRAEMQQRAKEKGITLPESRMGMNMGPGKGGGPGMGGPGMGGGPGPRSGAAPTTPPTKP